MERLWAPWRMEYVTADEKPGCIFCNMPDEKRDHENMILFRGRLSFIMMNAFPYNNGHMLIAPYRHVGDFSNLTADEMLDVMRVTRIAKEVLERAFCPQGFNIGMNLGRIAGAGIADHIHVHVVPRWNGDTNFMPVIADIKVMPQALDKAYQTLKSAIEGMDLRYDSDE